MRRGALLVLVSLFGCASPPATAPTPMAAPEPALVVVAPPPPPDRCGATQQQHLVGRPRTEIPIPIRPELQRVACETCPITQDFNPNRLNFYFDAGSGRITKVSCG